MAKVTIPNEKLQNYKTVGASITLKERGSGFFVSRRAGKQVRGESSQIFVEENSEAIQKEWQGLTPTEKESWEELGSEVVQTGYFTFYNNYFKGMTNSVCGVAICGLNRCVDGE